MERHSAFESLPDPTRACDPPKIYTNALYLIVSTIPSAIARPNSLVVVVVVAVTIVIAVAVAVADPVYSNPESDRRRRYPSFISVSPWLTHHASLSTNSGPAAGLTGRSACRCDWSRKTSGVSFQELRRDPTLV